MTKEQRRATKDYFQALANLSDRYLFENMSNRDYVEQRNAIETNYLKKLYNLSYSEIIQYHQDLFSIQKVLIFFFFYRLYKKIPHYPFYHNHLYIIYPY